MPQPMYVHLCNGLYAHLQICFCPMDSLPLQGCGTLGTPSILALSLPCRGHVGQVESFLPVGTCSCRGLDLRTLVLCPVVIPWLLNHIYLGLFGCYQRSSPETQSISMLCLTTASCCFPPTGSELALCHSRRWSSGSSFHRETSLMPFKMLVSFTSPWKIILLTTVVSMKTLIVLSRDEVSASGAVASLESVKDFLWAEFLDFLFIDFCLPVEISLQLCLGLQTSRQHKQQRSELVLIARRGISLGGWR